MDQHKTYDKENFLNTKNEGGDDKAKEKKKADKFIWSYIIRPVRKDFTEK